MKNKEYPEEIIIINRDGYDVRLINITNGVYKLKLPIDLPVGITYDDDNSIYAIDPAGGPYISVCNIIEGFRVIGIEWSKLAKAFLVGLGK